MQKNNSFYLMTSSICFVSQTVRMTLILDRGSWDEDGRPRQMWTWTVKDGGRKIFWMENYNFANELSCLDMPLIRKLNRNSVK